MEAVCEQVSLMFRSVPAHCHVWTSLSLPAHVPLPVQFGVIKPLMSGMQHATARAVVGTMAVILCSFHVAFDALLISSVLSTPGLGGGGGWGWVLFFQDPCFRAQIFSPLPTHVPEAQSVSATRKEVTRFSVQLSQDNFKDITGKDALATHEEFRS